MLTVKCDCCGKNIHIGLGYQSSCMYCGSPVNNSVIAENNYYSKLAIKCENKLSNRDFSNAIVDYDEAIYLFPDKSRLYWGRMLAHNLVTDDLSLILNGVSLAEDSDYVLTLHFADDSESDCLHTLAQTRDSIAKDLLVLLNKKEKEAILATGIEAKQKSLEERINALRDELRDSIQKMDEAEKTVRNAVVDGNVLIKSEKKRINEYVSRIERIINEVKTKAEVSLEEKISYKEESDRLLSACNNEWQTISSNSNGEAFVKYMNAQEERRKRESEIDAIMRQFNQVKDELDHIVQTVSETKLMYKYAKSHIEEGSFASAKLIIGENNFTSVVQNYLKAAK